MKSNDTSRREFLAAAGLLATAAVTGCATKENPFQPYFFSCIVVNDGYG